MNSSTIFGGTDPADQVIVTGVYGIYRLSKHVLLSLANTTAGGAPSSESFNHRFDSGWMQANQQPIWQLRGRDRPVSGLSSFTGSPNPYTATGDGRIVHPQRVTDNDLATTSASGNARRINGQDVSGKDEDAPTNSGTPLDTTDSRNPAWSTMAMDSTTITVLLRDSRNGGRNVRLPSVLGNSRAMEAQKVRYDDLDGDATTDEHEYALPLFILPGGIETVLHPDTGATKVSGVLNSGELTSLLPDSSTAAAIVEAPGQYLRYALGSPNLYMA